MQWRPKWWLKVLDDIERIEQAAVRIERAADAAKLSPERLRRTIQSSPPPAHRRSNGASIVITDRKSHA